VGKFCLYSDSEYAPCYAITTNRCHDLKDMLNGVFKVDSPRSVPVKVGCLQLAENHKQFDVLSAKCINCMFCVFGCTGHRGLLSCDFKLKKLCYDLNQHEFSELKNNLLPKLFTGKFIELPKVETSNIKVKYQDFESFTSVDETENIAVWSANAMKYLSCSMEPKISLEVHVKKTGARDGRLDVTMYNMRDRYLMVAETKTTFEDMMKDMRFESQLFAYNKELDNRCGSLIKHCTFLIIGGKESSLLPQTHPQCTSVTGNQAGQFYSILQNRGYFFISANAMLALGLKKMFDSMQKYSLENIFDKVISTGNYVGLLSCGAIDRNLNVVNVDNIL